MIKRIDENGKIKTYNNLEQASKDVLSKFDFWKIQLFISYAIDTKTRAFKSRWEKVN